MLEIIDDSGCGRPEDCEKSGGIEKRWDCSTGVAPGRHDQSLQAIRATPQ